MIQILLVLTPHKWHTVYAVFTIGEELHRLALEVIESLRAQVGREVFARAYASVQQEVQSKRLVRKRQRALEV